MELCTSRDACERRGTLEAVGPFPRRWDRETRWPFKRRSHTPIVMPVKCVGPWRGEALSLSVGPRDAGPILVSQNPVP